MNVEEAIAMLKEKNKNRSRGGSRIKSDWDYLLRNEGEEFPIEGDRNSNRNACAQYFGRQGIKVKIYSRVIGGVPHLMVKRVK